MACVLHVANTGELRFESLLHCIARVYDRNIDRQIPIMLSFGMARIDLTHLHWVFEVCFLRGRTHDVMAR